MTNTIFRNYLEIKSLKDFREVQKPTTSCRVDLLIPKDFQLNKFFYKNIGKNYRWTDRLIWDDQKWINYVSNEKQSTYVLKNKDEIAGYFESIFNQDTRDVEISYFGILKEYFGMKLGGYLISEAIKYSFSLGASRVWLHTCSLDHKNALNNYLSRGMKVFKKEQIKV